MVKMATFTHRIKSSGSLDFDLTCRENPAPVIYNLRIRSDTLRVQSVMVYSISPVSKLSLACPVNQASDKGRLYQD